MAFLLLAGGATAAQAGAQDGEMTAQACKDASGGYWCYGTEYGVPPLKGCYSNYKHNRWGHSATVAISDGVETDHAAAGQWARAELWTTHPWDTCYANYNV